MVAGVHDPQHSQAVSALRLMTGTSGVPSRADVPDTDMAIAETDGDRHSERAAQAIVTATAITRTHS